MKKTILACALAFVATPCFALSVGPLNRVFTGNEQSSDFQIVNTKDKDMTYQITVCKLEIDSGIRNCKETDNIVFKPEIARVGAKKTQTVRLMKKDKSSKEDVYVLTVAELKDPELKNFQALYAMEFPWFWRAPDATPSLTARWENSCTIKYRDVVLDPITREPIRDEKTGEMQEIDKTRVAKDCLYIKNNGTASAHIYNLTAGSKTKGGNIGYVLAGEERSFPLEGFPHLDISVMVNQKLQNISAR